MPRNTSSERSRSGRPALWAAALSRGRGDLPPGRVAPHLERTGRRDCAVVIATDVVPAQPHGHRVAVVRVGRAAEHHQHRGIGADLFELLANLALRDGVAAVEICRPLVLQHLEAVGGHGRVGAGRTEEALRERHRLRDEVEHREPNRRRIRAHARGTRRHRRGRSLRAVGGRAIAAGSEQQQAGTGSGQQHGQQRTKRSGHGRTRDWVVPSQQPTQGLHRADMYCSPRYVQRERGLSRGRPPKSP